MCRPDRMWACYWRLRVPRARGGDCARSFRSGSNCSALYFYLYEQVPCVDCSGSVVFVNAVEAGHTARQMKLWYGVTNLHPQLTC